MHAYVVGAGITGSVIARHLAECGCQVTLMERRDHIGGNMHDYWHDTGILVHKYGPHIFHTKKPELCEYLHRFGTWSPFRLECIVFMNGKYTPSPFNFQTVDDFFPTDWAARIKEHLVNVFPGRRSATILELLESPDALVSEYARFLYNSDYAPYTAKQWGIRPEDIERSVFRRVPVILSYERGYFDDAVQIMPDKGFHSIFEKMLNHENLTVQLHTDALQRIHVDVEQHRVLLDGQPTLEPVVYTGAIDELLNECFGKLPYRSLRFEWEVAAGDSFQKAPVVMYPQVPDYTRITEYNKLPVQPPVGRTVYAREYPLKYEAGSKQEPYYAIPTEENDRLYRQYRAAVALIGNLYLCGRLAEYRYYNMDQALEQALLMCKHLDCNVFGRDV